MGNWQGADIIFVRSPRNSPLLKVWIADRGTGRGRGNSSRYVSLHDFNCNRIWLKRSILNTLEQGLDLSNSFGTMTLGCFNHTVKKSSGFFRVFRPKKCFHEIQGFNPEKFGTFCSLNFSGFITLKWSCYLRPFRSYTLSLIGFEISIKKILKSYRPRPHHFPHTFLSYNIQRIILHRRI